MFLRSRSKAGKSGRNSPFRDFSSLFYALLCLAIVGLFVWLLWRPSPGGQGPPVPPPAPVVRAAAATNKQPTPAAPLPQVRAPEATGSDTRPVENVLEAQI